MILHTTRNIRAPFEAKTNICVKVVVGPNRVKPDRVVLVALAKCLGNLARQTRVISFAMYIHNVVEGNHSAKAKTKMITKMQDNEQHIFEFEPAANVHK